MLFTFFSTLILVVNSINPLQLNNNKNKNSYVNFNHEKYGVLINDLTKFVGKIFIWPQSFPQGFVNNDYGKNPTDGSILKVSILFFNKKSSHFFILILKMYYKTKSKQIKFE